MNRYFYSLSAKEKMLIYFAAPELPKYEESPSSSSDETSERQPRERLLGELEKCATAQEFAGQFDVTGGGGFSQRVKDFSPAEKQRVAIIVKKWISNSAELSLRPSGKNTKQPSDYSTYLEDIKLSRLLWEFDQDSYEKQLQEKIPAMLRQAFQLAEKEYNPSNTLDGYRLQTEHLYILLDLQSLQQHRQACEQEISRIETKISAGFTPKEVDAYAEKWLKSSQEEVMPTHTNIDAEKMIDQILKNNKPSDTQKSFEDLAKSKHLQKGSDGYLTYESDTGENSTQWRIDFYPTSPFHGGFFTFRCLETDALVTITGAEFRKRFLQDRGRFFTNLEQEALANKKREEDGRQKLEAFDLPKDKKSAHFRVFPRRYDKVLAVNLQTSMLLSDALKKRYGENMLIRPIIFEDDPRKELEHSIADAHKAGARCFCIDLFSHGDREDGLISFRPSMKAQDISALANQFQDCTFNVSSMACFGGGLRDGMLDEFKKDEAQAALEKEMKESSSRVPLKNRVNIFVQSRPNIENINALKGHETYATPYYLSLVQALHEGKTWGSANMKARMEVKQRTFLHAESILNGTLVQNTLQKKLDASVG